MTNSVLKKMATNYSEKNHKTIVSSAKKITIGDMNFENSWGE